ncbi:LanC-like protein GCL2 [Tanacetum coccineum]
MSDRYFDNFMLEYVEEKASVPRIEEEQDDNQDSLLKLLKMPYPTLCEKLQRAALDLKETIVVETWGVTRQKVQDFTIYTGTLGTAFLLLKSYQVSNNKNDLDLCSEIIKACDSASSDSSVVSFLSGHAGVCALGAVVAKYHGNEQMVDYYLTQFKKIKVTEDGPVELIRGRTGYLWSPVVDKIIENGREMGVASRCPLMFEYSGDIYWGAAKGLAGIMYVLMHFGLPPDAFADVNKTLKYMINNRFPSRNYPRDEAKRSDELVYWCHGAPGVALTLTKAAEVFEDKEFLEAAIDASKVVWSRGLLKKVGMCHGINGNAYVFLSLYRMTGNVEFLHKAKAFACFLLDRAHKLISEGQMHGGDTPYSLFEGIGGMAYLFLDMNDPANAKFPAHEL